MAAVGLGGIRTTVSQRQGMSRRSSLAYHSCIEATHRQDMYLIMLNAKK